MAQPKEDFWSRYSKMCLQDKIYPSKSIIKNLKSTDLSCIVESLRSEHWKYLLLALCRDNSLTKVHFASCVSPHEVEVEDDELVAPENVGLKLIPVPAAQVDCQAELFIDCHSTAVYRGFIPVVDIQTKMKKQAQYFPTPYGRTPKNINNIMITLDNLLQTSETLSILKLENLSISIEDAEHLAHGLSKSSSLKYFSLSGCRLDEGAIPIICKSLNTSCVSWIDLSFCALNPPDIEAVANVIKQLKRDLYFLKLLSLMGHLCLQMPLFDTLKTFLLMSHCVRRRNEMFQKTLRNQIPYLQDMPGLTRISLNYNSLEDKALKILIESLDDDLWVKALDLQNCDIDNSGVTALLDLASRNTSLVIIDLRMNQIDESLHNRIANQLEQNKAGKDVKCSELSLWKPSELVRRYNNIGKAKTLKKPTARKFKVSKKVTKSYLNVKKNLMEEFLECLSHEKHPEISYTYLMPPKSKSMPAKEKNCSAGDGLRDASSQTPVDSHDINEILAMVKNLRHRLQSEMKIRKYLMAKYRQVSIENAELRQMLKSQNDDIYIDQETYFDVKHTFEKLKVFFDVMKKYGLWEYISMLGFDESTDVVLEENISQKCMKVTRDVAYATVENPVEFDREACCNCRKLDYKHRKMEPPDDGHHCMAGTSAKPLHSKLPVKGDRINEKITYKVSQGAVHHVLNSGSVSGRMPDNANLPQDNIKPSGSKQPGSASPNTTAGTQMLFKKFSYSNMPKQLKELVSPADFYNIVQKELERCETEAKNPYIPVPAESFESSSSAQVSSAQSKKVSHKAFKCRNEVNEVPTAERRGSSSSHNSKVFDNNDDEEEEDFDNTPINELVAREKAIKKSGPPKKDAKSSASSVSSSKIYKNTNHAKIKETQSLSKSEEVLPQSKQKMSSSQANSKASTYNASSDELNSSDSIVTASDNASSSSSSSNKSRKLSNASTFGEIDSIVDTEVVSETFLPAGSLNEPVKSSAGTVASGHTGSHSSTLKDASEMNSNKPAISGSSSIKDLSKKSNNSAKTNAQPQGKGKNANKHNKNRPKSNSSKSSSIPSLSDITTVSSKSLKTYSVMQQIPGSDDDKSKGKK